jgi:hypothetical protein
MIKLLIWLLFPTANAVLDWYIIERDKKPIDHLVEFIFRGFAVILYGALVFDAQAGTHGFAVIAYEVCSFYIVFELVLNELRGKPWNYLGNTAMLDKILSRRRWLYYALKTISIAGAVLAAVYLINYGRL